MLPENVYLRRTLCVLLAALVILPFSVPVEVCRQTHLRLKRFFMENW